MSKELSATEQVAKSRKGVIAAVGGLAVVAAIAVGVMYTAGMGPFATGESAGTPAPTTQPKTDGSDAGAEETITPVAAVATAALPPEDAQRLMFFEQLASAEQIEDLVADRWAEFTVSSVVASGDSAELRVKGVYREGGEISATLIMRKYGDAWYFSSITRDGNPMSTPVDGDADMDVARAMCELQSASQDLPKALVDGGYNKVVIDTVTQGSGTATLNVTVSGPAGEAKGTITTISKVFNGVTRWFITGFSK